MKQVISYDEYIAIEARNPFHEEIKRNIIVTNLFDERLWEEVDKMLEDMSILLDFPLPKSDEKRLEKTV